MKGIIFDFDGVIADTYDLNKAIVEEIGYKVSHETFKAHHDGNVIEKPIIAFTPETQEKFFSKYSKRITGITPFLTSKEIETLKEISPLFIISSTRETAISKFLNHNKLEHFDEILGFDFHKSKVEKFKYLFKKYNLEPNEIIFVSDTLGDVLEAKKAEVKTIAVDYGFHDRKRLQKGDPFAIVSSFDQLLETIQSM